MSSNNRLSRTLKSYSTNILCLTAEAVELCIGGLCSDFTLIDRWTFDGPLNMWLAYRVPGPLRVQDVGVTFERSPRWKGLWQTSRP